MYSISWMNFDVAGVDYAAQRLTAALKEARELNPRFLCAHVTVPCGGWLAKETYLVAIDKRLINPAPVATELSRMFGLYQIHFAENVVVFGTAGPSDTVKSSNQLETVLKNVASKPHVFI
jgi:hypothetical protein